ncbi:hypothetical protein FA95DRAFT_1575333 [Auriscalpium vulgare]|uniref:Uncharacterized protein n=1 Tax=Auriscalpium vulgare TaxID=40419 RepID=A0ACB8RGD9_9AGAM|nr:hypothetical protein FA95DRAFT_1575333 [Auriscalpium vulgare]
MPALWNTDTYDDNDTLPRGIASEVPMCGTYSVFTLNPTATVEALRDPIATEQAQKLPTTRYVGVLVTADTKGFTARRYYSGQLAVVSQGLPKSSPEKGVEEDMFIPIDPATHPAGRAGVSPKPPLPWDNLYHHTAVTFDVRVATRPEGSIDDSKSPMLSVNDVVHIKMTSGDDKYRSYELVGEPDAEEDTSEQLSEYSDGESDLAQPESEGRSLPAYSICSGNGSDAGRQLDEVMDEFFSQGLPGRDDPRVYFTPVVDFDLDLTTVTEFASADGLSKEIKELERYATSAQSPFELLTVRSIWKEAQEREREYREAKLMQIKQQMEQARQQRHGGGDEKREPESLPTTLQDSCIRRFARVPIVLQSAGKRLRSAAKKVVVKARHPMSIRRSPTAKVEREAAAIPAKAKSAMSMFPLGNAASVAKPSSFTAKRKASDRILNALTSCVRWRQPDESDAGLEKS